MIALMYLTFALIHWNGIKYRKNSTPLTPPPYSAAYMYMFQWTG